MIEKTFFAVSQDESKYNLNGIFCQVQETSNQLRLVATDGHRLSMIDKKIVNACQFGINQGRDSATQRDSGIEETGRRRRERSDNSVSWTTTPWSARIRPLLSCAWSMVNFPITAGLFRRPMSRRPLIAVDPFLHALRRMIILSSEKSRGVKMKFKKNLLEVSSSNPELGDAREELDIEYQGPDISIGFNARYLLDILQVQDEDRIRMILKDNLSPGLIKPVDEDGYLAVIMPMRL